MRGITYVIARSIMFFAYGACMMYGGQLVVNERLPISTVFTVTQALIMGTMSIANSLAYGPNLQKGLIAAGKINQLLQRIPKVLDPIDVNNKLSNNKGNVNYNSIEFAYPTRPNTLVLQGLNIEVKPGQTVALVGQSGCGKSTTIQLLERFYDCAQGNVTIGDTDIKSVTLNDVRSELGMVSQEPVLFDKTIGENIAYGDNSREIGKEEIIEAAKSANIHNFIVSLPLGYDTRLGEKGTQLSGGQKQRIAIARALIRNPKILLLDEATSALDSESEKVVQAALDSAREGRTCITIAHRLTTIVDADVIFLFDQGQVAEQGTHKELLAKRGRYYNLFTLQSSSSVQ